MTAKSITLSVEWSSAAVPASTIRIPLPDGWSDWTEAEQQDWAEGALADHVSNEAPSGWYESDEEPEV